VFDNLQLLHVTQVATLLRCSRRHVYTLIAAGRIRAVKVSARTTRVAASEVERFVSENTRTIEGAK
jgi:excisionase family DNA binding protein